MAILLRLIGVGWTMVGVVNLFRNACWPAGDDAMTVLVVIVNLLIFIFPGMALREVGAAVASKTG